MPSTASPTVRPLIEPTSQDRRAFAVWAEADLAAECDRRTAAGLPQPLPGEAQTLRAQALARYVETRKASQVAFRACLLRTAARWLEQRWSTTHGGFLFERHPYTWRFDLPGVLRVFDDVAGDCVAVSLPGQPAELAPIPTHDTETPA